MQSQYYSKIVSSSSGNPWRLWQMVNNTLHRKLSSPLPTFTSASSLADSFASFFTDKISKHRLSLVNNSTPVSPHSPSLHLQAEFIWCPCPMTCKIWPSEMGKIQHYSVKKSSKFSSYRDKTGTTNQVDVHAAWEGSWRTWTDTWECCTDEDNRHWNASVSRMCGCRQVESDNWTTVHRVS